MKHSIKVIIRLQDNGDGGYSLYAYNTENELIADHPRSREFREVKGKWDYFPIVLTEKQRNDILREDDPHENGYIGHKTIEIDVDENGTVTLANPLSFHCGQ